MESFIVLIVIYILPCLISIFTILHGNIMENKGIKLKFFVSTVFLSLIPLVNIILFIGGIYNYGVILYNNFGDVYIVKPKKESR